MVVQIIGAGTPLEAPCPLTKVKEAALLPLGQMRRQHLLNSHANEAFQVCKFYPGHSHKVGIAVGLMRGTTSAYSPPSFTGFDKWETAARAKTQPQDGPFP